MNTVIGTVISGTFRPQDLLPAMLDALRDISNAGPEYVQITQALPSYPFEDDTCDWWIDESEWFLEDLHDTLNDYAPEYCYFGANPQDGADFGFWPDFEEIELDIYADLLIEVGDPSEISGPGTYYFVNDHGNASLITTNDGENLTTVWSVV